MWQRIVPHGAQATSGVPISLVPVLTGIRSGRTSNEARPWIPSARAVSDTAAEVDVQLLHDAAHRAVRVGSALPVVLGHRAVLAHELPERRVHQDAEALGERAGARDRIPRAARTVDAVVQVLAGTAEHALMT